MITGLINRFSLQRPAIRIIYKSQEENLYSHKYLQQEYYQLVHAHISET